MKSSFYNRTTYPPLGLPVPDFFLKVDEQLEATYPDDRELLSSRELAIVENLCRRLADLEFYAAQIRKQLAQPDKFTAALFAGTFLVGHLSSAKSILDASAIAVCHALALPLAPREQDLSKPKFWSVTGSTSSAHHDKYSPFRALAKEVVRWRDAAVHRLTPLLMVQGPGHPAKTAPDLMKIRMLATPDATFSTLFDNPASTQWIEVLALHDAWSPQFLALAESACQDLNELIAGKRGPKSA
jgi:hypothetical protein